MSDQSQNGEQQFAMPKPGSEHERLKPFEGTFRATVRLWFGPGEPQESTGTMVNSFQLDGMYLHQDYVGDPNDGPFPSFCGKGYWGYNTVSERYEGFWIDNASSAMQFETGHIDDSGKTWTMMSEFVHPQTKQTMQKRSVIELADNDHHTMEMYFVGPDGSDMKTMEIDYERAK